MAHQQRVRRRDQTASRRRGRKACHSSKRKHTNRRDRPRRARVDRNSVNIQLRRHHLRAVR